MHPARPVALTVAGSDSGGGAGIQADLSTFQALQVHGTCAITALTAQNPDRVSGVLPVAPEFVVQQVQAVFEAFPVRAVKTGMLGGLPVVKAMAGLLESWNGIPLVVDPVMVATSGARLIEPDALECFCERILPHAWLVTPNLPEAAVLLGSDADAGLAPDEVAQALSQRFGVPFLVKGGHGEGEQVEDWLAAEGAVKSFSSPRLSGGPFHGTGCTLAAAITAWAARGRELADAVDEAKRFVSRAIQGHAVSGGHAVLGWSSGVESL